MNAGEHYLPVSTVHQPADLIQDVLNRPARELRPHLAGCPHCTEYLAQIRATIAAAGQIEPDDLSREALDELVGLYRTWRTG